jgi:hypothetical protein
VAAGPAGLQIVDLGQPDAPAVAGAVSLPGDARGVVVRGDLAYVAGGPAGLLVVDVHDPAAPRLIGSALLPAGGGVLLEAGSVDAAPELGLAVVGTGFTGARVVDVSDPAHPRFLSSMPLVNSFVQGVLLRGSTAFLADLFFGLHLVDLGQPSAPRILSTLGGSAGGAPVELVLDGDLVFTADQFFNNTVPILDVADLLHPVLRGFIDYTSFGFGAGSGIAVDGRFAYWTAGGSDLKPRTDGSSRLYVGQYLELDDTAGSPPTVQISAPAPGTALIEGATVPVTVAAGDDVLVASVDLLVDGRTIDTAAVAPYVRYVTVPKGSSTLTLGARAVDLAGSVATAADLVLPVVPDPGTTAVGRVLDSLGQPAAGATVTAGGASTTAGADGTFTLAGLSGVPPTLTLDASASVGGRLMFGRSGRLPTVRGGVTAAGTIVLNGSVAIVSPAAGATVFERSHLLVVVAAADPLALSSVTVLANGQPAATSGSFVQPYQLVVPVPVGVPALTLVAQVLDQSGQVETSEPVVLAVVPDPLTTVIGTVVDGGGLPVAGATVTIQLAGSNAPPSTGPSAITQGDGSFSLAGVSTVDGAISVAVSFATGGDVLVGTSAAVEPVQGGTTDLGTTTAHSTISCVTGTLVFQTCLSGPVTTPVPLFLLDNGLNMIPAGTVDPDASGHFCAILRRNQVYVLRREDFVCSGMTSACHGQIELTDPSASGVCGDPTPACQDLGAVTLKCNFFGGS